MTQPRIHWLTDNQQLAQAAEQWQAFEWLTVDTEFVRTRTFWPEAGLIQLGRGEDVWLVDPLTITDWAPLKALMANPDITKVMHAMGEDLELFRHLLGELPVAVFDTQIAAAFAGIDFSIGYQRLIENLLGITVPKGETRSDWLARPLTPSQVQYAALDVFYLGKVYPQLVQTLEQKGFSQWHREDCIRQIDNVGRDTDPAEAWRDVKLAWQLRPQQLAVLKTLCQWRETQARARNLSRNRLAPSAALWELARFQPDSLYELRRIKGMKPQAIRQSGEAILQQIAQGQQVASEDYPQPPAGPLPKKVQPCVDAIKRYCRSRAHELELMPELIPAKVWLGKLLRGWLASGEFAMPEGVSGWRVETVLQPLVSHLNSLQFDSPLAQD